MQPDVAGSQAAAKFINQLRLWIIARETLRNSGSYKMAELAAEQQQAKSMGDRFTIAVSRFAGSMNFVYLHAVVFGLWAAANMGQVPRVHNLTET